LWITCLSSLMLCDCEREERQRDIDLHIITFENGYYLIGWPLTELFCIRRKAKGWVKLHRLRSQPKSSIISTQLSLWFAPFLRPCVVCVSISSFQLWQYKFNFYLCLRLKNILTGWVTSSKFRNVLQVTTYNILW